MRKRARSVLTGLLVLCCVVAGFVPVVHVQADSSSSAGRNIVVTKNADLVRTAYPLAVSAQTAAPVESPSSGPWQTAWAWIQKAVHSTGMWIAEATHSTGTWIASLYMSTRDFFVSGQALKVVQTATQAITDFAVRLFLPLSVLDHRRSCPYHPHPRSASPAQYAQAPAEGDTQDSRAGRKHHRVRPCGTRPKTVVRDIVQSTGTNP